MDSGGHCRTILRRTRKMSELERTLEGMVARLDELEEYL
jgi:hypothetical protein